MNTLEHIENGKTSLRLLKELIPNEILNDSLMGLHFASIELAFNLLEKGYWEQFPTEEK